ncbi:MAG: hypothetical protein BRC28_02695, partial [Nanohaloarchaea archaeon SW_4_43_9]
YGILGVAGIVMLLLSLRTAEEDLSLWERKVHYILFLTLYGLLFALFWVAAVISQFRGERTW